MECPESPPPNGEDRAGQPGYLKSLVQGPFLSGPFLSNQKVTTYL